MRGPAAAAGAASPRRHVAAAEAQMMKKQAKSTEGKPAAAKPASEYKSVVKAANMPSGGAGGGVSPFSGATPARAKSSRKEAQLVASAAATVSPLSGKPIARTRRGANVAPVEPVVAEAMVAPAYEIPASMQQELASFRPVLQPIAERLQRIAKGDSRDDLRRILGSPASKVTIPADRDVSEIYYYQEKGRIIGTIRLEAGSVTRVSIDSL